jgi:hypothetical protein
MGNNNPGIHTPIAITWMIIHATFDFSTLIGCTHVGLKSSHTIASTSHESAINFLSSQHQHAWDNLLKQKETAGRKVTIE